MPAYYFCIPFTSVLQLVTLLQKEFAMRTTFLFISVLFFTACKKSSTGNNQLLPANTASTMPDISYGTDAKQKIDVYLPANRAAHTTKVMLLIHGGDWNRGDKNDFTASITYMKKAFTFLCFYKYQLPP